MNDHMNLIHRTGLLTRPYGAGIDGSPVELWSFARGVQAYATRSPDKAPLESGWTARLAQESDRPAPLNGFTVPDAVLARTVDAASGLVAKQSVTISEALRPVLAAGKAGVSLLSGVRGDLHVATLSTTAPYWVGDGDPPGAASEPVIGRVLVEPKQVRTTVSYADALLRSAVDESRVDHLMIADQARALAGALDAAVFAGTGQDDQPEGLLHNAEVPVIVGGVDGAVIAWPHLQAMLQSVLEAGGDPDRVAWAMSPRIARQLMSSTVPTSGDDTRLTYDPDLGGGNTLLGKPVIVTSMIPDNLTKGDSVSACSMIVCGDFQHLLCAFWGGLDVLVDPYTNAINGIIRCTSSLTVGVAVRRPTVFAVMKDALVDF